MSAKISRPSAVRPAHQPATQAREQRLQRARELLETHVDQGLSLAQLAQRVGLSPAHLQRSFQALFGLSPRRYLMALRLARFKQASRGARDALDAGLSAGFGSNRALYQAAREGLGMTPGAYLRGGAGVELGWSTARTSAGLALAAQGPKGVCALFLGDSRATLLEQLQAEFPAARLSHQPAALRPAFAALRAALRGQSAPRGRVALELAGSEFQRAVWAELGRIPRGATRSYAQIAAALECPGGARAVGSACGKNRIAVLIPCHRALCSDGSLSGYRWGVQRKRALLEAEARSR